MTTIIFFVSLCALCAMLSWKVFEIKVRRIHFLSDLFIKGDSALHGFIDQVIFKYNRYNKIFNIFMFDFLPSYIYEKLVHMKDYVSKKYYSTGDGFRGRRMLRTNGSVSFFLERLSEDKTSIDSNRV